MRRWVDLARTRSRRYRVDGDTQAERVAAEFAARSLELPGRAAFYRWLVEHERMGEGPARRERGERDG